jgi:thioredoxin-related protein
MKILACLSLLLACAAPAAAAVPAPRVHAQTIDQLPQPLPLPYTASANAQADVAKARALAKRQHKRLLIDLGGNWCLDCRVLAGIMELPELKPFLAGHFVIVKVDIGRYDKNGEIAAHYGIAAPHGAPALLVVDAAHDRLLNGDRLLALADARNMTPQALADWLAQWA